MKSPGHPITALSLTLASALLLAGCSAGAQDSEDSVAAEGETIEVEDNNGAQ
ncbi:hypothetical protein [Nocardiopsis alba]|jgi:iron complex transport system substrate-binding protein|nr:hypothetical protein [Nocardiopsis alba]